MRKLLLSLACVALLSHGVTAYAQKDKPPKKSAVEVAFEKLDTSSDGQVSVEEFCVDRAGKPLEKKPREVKEKMFKKYDTDGSGGLSLEEFKLKGAKPKTPK